VSMRASEPGLDDLGLTVGETIYHNPLGKPEDLADWRMEGPGATSFPMGRMRLESTADPELDQEANLVYRCPDELPDAVRISWDFRPICEPGLAISFFAARGREGQDLFDPSLTERHGPYDQYHHGDIDALHVSYFRRRHPSATAFQTCNLRKSHGFHLVAQGGDPLPAVVQSQGRRYRIQIVKIRELVRFTIDRLPILTWRDDGTRGAVLGAGKFGFRQMAPLIAEYGDLRVESLQER